MWSLFTLFNQCSYPVIITKLARSFKFVILCYFSSPVDLIQDFGVDLIPFPLFTMLSHSGAPINHSPLAIHLFRSVEDISGDSCFHSRSVQAISRLLSHSSHLIQPAQSFFKLFNGVSFEWALTHRSFPRILPNSSNSFRSILKFIAKFDVRMNYHQSNVFLQDLSNSFHCWFNLSNCHSGVPQQFMVVFLVIILNIWRLKKSFS